MLKVKYKKLKFDTDYLINFDLGMNDYNIYPEIIGLLFDYRKFILTPFINEGCVYKLQNICRKIGLKINFYKSKFHGYEENLYSHFPNYHKTVATIYKSSQNIKSFFNALNSNNAIKIGKLLGYPLCCCKFHYKQGQEGDVNCINTYNNSKKPFNFYLFNLNHKYRIISHFPCSYHCIESIKLSKNILKIIKEINGIKLYNTFIERMREDYIFINSKYYPIKYRSFHQNHNLAFELNLSPNTMFYIDENSIKSDEIELIRNKDNKNYLIFKFK